MLPGWLGCKAPCLSTSTGYGGLSLGSFQAATVIAAIAFAAGADTYSLPCHATAVCVCACEGGRVAG